MNSALRVVVVEPSAEGHYMILYLRHLLRAARERGWRVDLLTTNEALQHPAYGVVRDEAGPSMQTYSVKGVPYPRRPNAANLLLYQFRLRRLYARLFRKHNAQHKCDVVYVGNLDHVDRALALLGSPFGRTPFAGMSIHVRHHHRSVGVRGSVTRSERLYAWLFNRLLRIPTLRALATIDETLSIFVQERRMTGFEKVHYVPDVTGLQGDGDRRATRDALLIDHDAFVVLVYGALHARKGIAELIAAAALPSCSKRVVILLAGQPDPTLPSILESTEAQRLRAEGRLIANLGFLSDEQETAVFAASDVVWVGYKNFFGTSGVLLQAGSKRLPVIGCRDGLIGWHVERHELGEVVDVLDGAALADVINRLLSDEHRRAHYGQKGAEFARAHTPGIFSNRLADMITIAAEAKARREA